MSREEMNNLLGPVDDEQRPLSVAELTSGIKNVLENAFPSVWVVGEISDLARPRSGHVYFTLKDEQSQIRAVIWRGVAQPAELRFGGWPAGRLPW